MNFLTKLENKFGKYAIPNLYVYIIGCIILGYVFAFFIPKVYSYLILEPISVFINHEYWRFFTWIFTIPYQINSVLMIIILPINLFFYFILGRALENFWGAFMYNLYIFGGMLLTNILYFIGGYYFYVLSPNANAHILNSISNGEEFAAINITKYMLISIFLAFSVVGGDNIVYFYFVLPVKMKYLAILDLIFLGYWFVVGGFFTRIIIFGSVVNFFIYFMINRNRDHASFADLRRRSKFVKAKQKGYKKARYNDDGTVIFPGAANRMSTSNTPVKTIHKCAVCGKTEVSDPNLEFRFCSKCNGNYEYCSEHIYTHEHIN